MLMMENKELLQKLETLEKRLAKLESQKKDNLSMFGRSYSQIGDSNSDCLIKTKGQVKIQWGTKFVDLIKDGKINADAKFIYKDSSVGTRDGIYIVDGGVWIVVNGESINLKDDTAYVSFLEEQKTSSDEKHQALQNIGFLYDSIEQFEASEGLQNGIIYIEGEQKLYIVSQGVLSNLNFSFPNPFTEQFIISKKDSRIGALVIEGNSEENSIKFNSMRIYSNDNSGIINLDNSLSIQKGSTVLLNISDTKFETNLSVKSNGIQSPTYFPGSSGYRIYQNNGIWVLEIDKIIERQQNTNNVPKTIPNYLTWNIISYWEENYDTENEQYILGTLLPNTYTVGDILEVSMFKTITDEEDNEITKEVIYELTIVNINNNEIIVESDNPIDESLLGQLIYLINDSDNPEYVTIKVKNNIDLISNFKNIRLRIGDLNELGYKESGLFCDNALFDSARYTSNIIPTEQDNSDSFASTKWVRDLINKIFPKGTIMAYHGNTIPNGWALCNGENGTPNLIGKFIKAGNTEKEDGSNETLLKVTDIPLMESVIKAQSNPGTLAGKIIPAFNKLEEFVVDKGGSSNYCLYTGEDKGGNGMAKLPIESLSSIMNMSASIGTEPDKQTAIKIEPKYYQLVFIMKIE